MSIGLGSFLAHVGLRIVVCMAAMMVATTAALSMSYFCGPLTPVAGHVGPIEKLEDATISVDCEPSMPSVPIFWFDRKTGAYWDHCDSTSAGFKKKALKIVGEGADILAVDPNNFVLTFSGSEPYRVFLVANDNRFDLASSIDGGSCVVAEMGAVPPQSSNARNQ